MRILSYLLLTTLLFSLSACSVTSPKLNQPLSVNTSAAKLKLKPTPVRSDDLSFIMTFSGGGTRSAALSYVVLQHLRDTAITINGKQRRLLDEVDLISSVSGGSFTSAYFGLFGEKLFQDFEEKFLKRRVQQYLSLSLFKPKTWFRLAPTLFERSDLAAEY